MPTKHIDEKTWDLVKKEQINAILLTKHTFKDAKILRILIKKGIETITEEDYIHILKSSKPENFC